MVRDSEEVDMGCRPGVRVFQWSGSVFFGVDSVPGIGSQVPGTRYRINVEGRIPSTGNRNSPSGRSA